MLEVLMRGWQCCSAYDLEHKVIGTVGAGRIGQRVLQRLKVHTVQHGGMLGDLGLYAAVAAHLAVCCHSRHCLLSNATCLRLVRHKYNCSCSLHTVIDVYHQKVLYGIYGIEHEPCQSICLLDEAHDQVWRLKKC